MDYESYSFRDLFLIYIFISLCELNKSNHSEIKQRFKLMGSWAPRSALSQEWEGCR